MIKEVTEADTVAESDIFAETYTGTGVVLVTVSNIDTGVNTVYYSGVEWGAPSTGTCRLSSQSTLSLSYQSTQTGGLETPTPDVVV